MARTAVKPQRVRAFIEQTYIATMQPADVLPSERTLAEVCGVARATVRAALKLLEQDGVVRSTPSIGTFVATPHLSNSAAPTSFSDDIRARGWVPGSRVIEATTVAIDAAGAHELGIEPGAECYEINRVRLADDVPLCVERICLPAALVPGLLDEPLDGSIYRLLHDHYDIGIVRHERRISAVNLDAEHSELLAVPERSAALYVTQRAYDQRGRRVEFGRSLYRGDRYDFAVVAQPLGATDG